MNEPVKNNLLPLLQNTLFINLANRQDRCVHIQQELARLGITSPVRFNAVKTQMGQVGCSMSHLKCLEKAKQAGWEQVFVCEDDAVFTNTDLLLNRLAKASTLEWNVLIVGGNNQRPFSKTAHDDFIQVHNCQTTTAYIVKQAYYDTLIKNIKEGLDKLLREPQMKHLFSIDIYWKKFQIGDTWIMATPATVTQLEGISDIEGLPVSYNRMMLDHEKKWMNGPVPPTQPIPPINKPVVKMGSGWGKGFLQKPKGMAMTMT